MAHWDDYAAMWADPRTTEYIGGSPREHKESWIKFLAGSALWDFFGYGYWAFTERKSGALVGVGGFAQWHRGIAELDGPVSGPVEYMQRLASSRHVTQVFVRHAFRYWMGRNETLDDAPTLIDAERAYTENGGSLKAMLASLLTSDSFLYRRIQTPNQTAQR